MHHYSSFITIKLTTIIVAILLQVIGVSTLKLTAYEGDKIFIPCFTTLSQSAYYWEIQGIFYSMNNLSSANIQGVSTGLTVYHALPQTAGSYSCYTHYGEKSTLIKISTVQLVIRITPQFAGKEGSSNVKTDSITKLSLRATRNAVIYIPCIPALAMNEVKFWEIDGSLYPVLDLPLNHHMHQGGIICDTSKGSVGSIYQCFSFSSEKKSLKRIYTIEITLFEPKELQTTTFTASHSITHHLVVVSKGVYFKDMSTDFQIRIIDVNEAEDCKPGDISTFIRTNSTVPWLESTKKYAPSFSIPSDVFSKGNTFSDVLCANSSGYECANLRYQFRVDTNESAVEHCVPEGSSLCLPLPSNLNGLVVIWPRQPQSDEDCVCGLFVETSDVSFTDCYCLKLHLSVYDVHIFENHLCWNNLTREKNGTKYLIARDSFYSTPTRQFENQGEIFIQDPDPFPPNITELFERPAAAACIQSRSSDWSPVLNTQLVIYDATNDIISNTTFSNDVLCIELTDFPQSCAPFVFLATAFSQCTRSPLTNQSIGNNLKSTCECLEKKFNLTLDVNTVKSTSFDASFNTTCLYLEAYDINQISNLFLRVVCENCLKKLISFKINCAEKSTNMMVTDLQPSTSYNVSVFWISPATDKNQTKSCEIVKKILITTTHSSDPINISWELVMGSLIVMVMAIVIWSSAMYFYRKWTQKGIARRSTNIVDGCENIDRSHDTRLVRYIKKIQK